MSLPCGWNLHSEVSGALIIMHSEEDFQRIEEGLIG